MEIIIAVAVIAVFTGIVSYAANSDTLYCKWSPALDNAFKG
jgi:hypothetical protein